MVFSDSPLVSRPSADQLYADLEAQLATAIADFGVNELKQMVDTAEAIRRVRAM